MTAAMAVRAARPGDAARILRLWHRGWHDAHAALVPPAVLAWRDPEHFRIWRAAAAGPTWVAADPRILGMVAVTGDELSRLFVDRAARGTGVAGTLLARAEDALRAGGTARAHLFCTAGNDRARRFYLRRGWRIAATFDSPLWVPPGIDLGLAVPTHRMTKTLLP